MACGCRASIQRNRGRLLGGRHAFTHWARVPSEMHAYAFSLRTARARTLGRRATEPSAAAAVPGATLKFGAQETSRAWDVRVALVAEGARSGLDTCNAPSVVYDLAGLPLGAVVPEHIAVIAGQAYAGAHRQVAVRVSVVDE